MTRDYCRYVSHILLTSHDFYKQLQILFLGAGGTEFEDEYLPETVVTCENDTASSNQQEVHCSNLVMRHSKCKFLDSKWDGVVL